MKLDTMEKEEAVRTGHLLVPSQGLLRKNWSKKFCALYEASSNGIQRLEVFDTEECYYRQNSSKIYPLKEIVKVFTASPQKHMFNIFEIRTESHSYQFAADTFHEMTEWLAAIQKVTFGVSSPLSAGAQTLDSGIEKRHSVVQHEENMLYSSVDTPEVYGIKVVETDAASRCGLKGEYYLVVTSVSVSIAGEASQGRIGRILYTWPYRHIRRYGCSKDSFSFEAGRKCVSGPGLFMFISNDANSIFKNVDAHVNALKTSQSEIDLQASPSPIMDKNGVFFSRHSGTGSDGSEVSPSSSKKNSLSEETGDKSSDDSHKDKKDVIEEKKMISKPPFAKPPRKSKLPTEPRVVSPSIPDSSLNRQSDTSLHHLYEDPSLVLSETTTGGQDPLYDEPEVRIEAWKTHGRDVDENETGGTKEEPEYAVLERTEENDDNAVLSNKLMQTQISGDSHPTSVANENDGYDHLALKRFQPTRYSNISADDKHVYGKLNTTKLSSNVPTSVAEYPKVPSYSKLPSSSSDATNCEQDQNKPSRDYENIVRSDSQIFVTGPEQLSPAHFMQNEAVYAQVIKKGSNNTK